MTTFFAFKTRFRSEQEILMNEKNKEMERLVSVVTFLFVSLFVFLSEKKLWHDLRYCFLGDVQMANYDIH